MTEKEIRDLFQQHGVELAKADVWNVQQALVIKHAALERLAAEMGIWWEAPTIIRSGQDEAVILATGNWGPEGKASPWGSVVQEWSIGEALIGANYRVSGKQAAYVYAMAEKRAKDRVILKLAKLHGAYSEEEADAFKDAAPSRSGSARQTEAAEQTGADTSSSGKSAPVEPEEVTEIKRKISEKTKAADVTELMLREDTQALVNELPEALAKSIRDHAKARFHELGGLKRAS